MKHYPFEEKTIEEFVQEAMLLLGTGADMTPEEEAEDDADYGYFEDD